jgi:uncharacterized protein YkwD
MKRFICYLLLFFTTLGAFAQPVTLADLNKVLKEASIDSLRYIERLAALHFHERLNQYRVKKGKSAIQWDETLWLTSYNHCLWMDANEKLSHDQKAGTRYFSGEGPGARYDFVAGGESPASWTGENALYNFSAYGKSAEDKANQIAEVSLQQWIRSPGHHENLLSSRHSMHGTAFRIDADGKVWGTDLFAYGSSHSAGQIMAEDPKRDFEKAVAESVAGSEMKEEKKAVVSVKPKKFNLAKSVQDISVSFYKADGRKRNKSLEKAALNHAEYLAYAKNASSEQDLRSSRFYGKTPFARVLKASGGLYLFLPGSRKLKEQVVLLEVDLATFCTDSILNLANEKLGEAPTKARKVGIGVFMKRKKNTLRIAVVRLYC